MSREAVRDLGYARVDLDRLRRCGRPEVIFCQGKLPEEVCGIALTLRQNNQLVLATRAEIAHFEAIQSRLPDAVFHRAGTMHHRGGRSCSRRLLEGRRCLCGNGRLAGGGGSCSFS